MRHFRLAGVLLLAIVLLGAGVLLAARPAGEASPAPTPDPPAAAASPSTPAASPAIDGAPPSTPAPTGTPAGMPSPGVAPTDPPPPTGTTTGVPSSAPSAPTLSGGVPIVPVVGFWSGGGSLTLAELRHAIEGDSPAFERVVLHEAHAVDTARLLGVTAATSLETADADGVRRAVAGGALGFLRASDVTPLVRALAVEQLELFGTGRIGNIAEWPLVVPDEAGTTDGWDAAAPWTMVAGGDMQLDRRMAYQVTTLGRGVDFPFDGGTVRITGRECCGRFGHRVPTWERADSEGRVRQLFSSAELAVANLEAAAVQDSRQHGLAPDFRDSLVFSGDPALLVGIRDAGFDFLSLANNHIHNGGAAGIEETRSALDQLGIRHAGAGKDLDAARQVEVLDAAGTSVAIVPCTTVGSMARPERPGARSCYDARLTEQLRTLAPEADVLIVFPHWGREYRTEPSSGQRRLAARWVGAGADLVIGAHSHWAGAVEEIDERLVFYSLGNLTFDQPWSEPTMQGLILELTFVGDRLVQAWPHPTLIVEDVQPNLLEMDGGGAKVLEGMRRASEGLLGD